MSEFNPSLLQIPHSIQSLFQPTKNSTVPMYLIDESSYSDDRNFVFQDFNNSSSQHGEAQMQREAMQVPQYVPHYTPLVFQQASYQEANPLFSIDTSYIIPRWSDEQVQISGSMSQTLANSSQSFSTQSTYSQVEFSSRNKNYKWSEQEDAVLLYLKQQSHQTWKEIAQKLSLLTGMPERASDQVSQHWIRVLNPQIQKGRWSQQEDDMLIRACLKCTPKQWKDVSQLVSGRTDIQCRYRLRQIGYKLVQRGILTPEWL